MFGPKPRKEETRVREISGRDRIVPERVLDAENRPSTKRIKLWR